MRLDLHALHSALARVGMALDAAYAAGGFHIGAERHEIIAQRSVGRDGKTAVPELAVEMLGVIAFDALTAAKAHIDGTPCGEESGQGPHIGGGRAAAAEARCESWIPGFIEEAPRPRVFELCRDQIKRFVPGDCHESRILVAALPGIGPLHRLNDAVRIVELL